MTKRWVAAVAEPEVARAKLGELARRGAVRVVKGLGPASLDGFGCVWIDAGDPAPVVAEALAAGTPVVVSERPPSGWGALAAIDPSIRIGGLGIGTLSVASLLGMLRREAYGALERLSVRAPGGRRVRPAASRRTAFDREGRVRWTLDADAEARLTALIAPFVRVADLLVPRCASALQVSELIPDRGAERAVLHGRAEGVSVCVEVDREIRGDEDWEIEARCARGTLLARFKGERDALLVRAPLRKDETTSSERPADELLVRHAMAGGALGRADDAARVLDACRALLASAATRRDSRPLTLVLVHVPRFKNRFDALRLPSLALARLSAYLRGYGFAVRVVDLEARHGEDDLSPFTDDARVDGWLAGASDEALTAALERMWPAIAEATRGARCLVGFSIVDYFGHVQMNLASALARLVKARTGHPTVLGGERDQVDGDRALSAHTVFDYVVDGDGEAALHELACLEAYGDRDPRFIEAVWSRSASGSVVKNRIVRSHLNAMPRPDFDGIPLERYRRAPSPRLLDSLCEEGISLPADIAPFHYLPYAFVKGCTADCTFCSAKEHLDVQAPEKSVDELLALAERYGTRDFVFLDNLVNLGPRWLERFCRALIDARADLQWTDSCRPTGIDDDLASMMREAGCLLLNFGAESGSDAVLARMQKGLTRADIVRTLRATHRAGIINRVNLIAGYFHETDADVDLTISLVEELEDEIDLIGCFQGFYLFPGMGVDPAREGIILRGGLDRLKTGQSTLAYDEVGGLSWEAKRESIDRSRSRILARIEALGIRTVDKIDEHDLFWLSRTFRDKALTRRHLLREPAPTRRAALPPGGQRGRVTPMGE